MDRGPPDRLKVDVARLASARELAVGLPAPLGRLLVRGLLRRPGVLRPPLAEPDAGPPRPRDHVAAQGLDRPPADGREEEAKARDVGHGSRPDEEEAGDDDQRPLEEPLGPRAALAARPEAPRAEREPAEERRRGQAEDGEPASQTAAELPEEDQVENGEDEDPPEPAHRLDSNPRAAYHPPEWGGG